jgi:hypothetical protein
MKMAQGHSSKSCSTRYNAGFPITEGARCPVYQNIEAILSIRYRKRAVKSTLLGDVSDSFRQRVAP